MEVWTPSPLIADFTTTARGRLSDLAISNQRAAFSRYKLFQPTAKREGTVFERFHFLVFTRQPAGGENASEVDTTENERENSPLPFPHIIMAGYQ